MKKVNLEIPDTNLYVKGWGLDTNGNRRIIVGFPNDKGFSIQTNGTLPETNRIIQSAIRELSDDELDVIGDEVVKYVKEFGSANVKSRLRISNWRLKAQHEKENGNKMESKLKSLVKRIIKEELQNIDEKFQDNEDNLQDAIDFAENTYDVYQQLERSYLPAVKRFVKRGTYDETKALKLMEYFWSVYCRPAYKRINKTDLKLSASDRQKFAKYFLDVLINDFDALK